MELSVLFQLALSMALGGLIGMEREYHEKPAGFRTNLIICVGATIFTIISWAIGTQYSQDPGRISAQIVSGVGFLGAGAILRDGNKISGLTTAAGIWMVSAVGMAVGYGYYGLALGSTALVLLVHIFLVRIERFFHKFARFQTIHLECRADWELLQLAEQRIAAAGVKLVSRRVSKRAGNFQVDCMIFGSSSNIDEAISRLMSMQEIAGIDY
jgi:putative Mg2+ transporter-C (MgtC) family protein